MYFLPNPFIKRFKSCLEEGKQFLIVKGQFIVIFYTISDKLFVKDYPPNLYIFRNENANVEDRMEASGSALGNVVFYCVMFLV